MRIENFVIICAILSIGGAVSACSLGNPGSQQPWSQQSGPTPQAIVNSSATVNSTIRDVDFANLTYPAKPEFSYGRRSFKLQHGRYEGDRGHDPLILASIAYGDVTGDGVEEAIVVIEVSIRGTAIPHIVYIYTAQSASPNLLWAFETGDRGDGGLRQAYAENGKLVVELYGKDKLIGKNLYDSDPFASEGVCCPKFFTRARYRWQGAHFRQEGKAEVLPNPETHGSLIMPNYGPAN